MTDTPDTSRAALEALAERLAWHSIVQANELEDNLLEAAATLRALAARVIELEAGVERLTKALETIASHGNHDNGHCGCHQNTFINVARAALERAP